MTRRLISSILPLLVAATALSACGDDDTETSTGSSSTETTEATTSTEPASDPVVVKAYFLRDEKVGPVGRDGTESDALEDALDALLEGPTPDEEQIGFSTTIPDDTDLLAVDVSDGVATIDLSSEFTTGGGSLSMMGRVAEVVFTATQFDEVESVSFEVEGEPLEVLGGEGLILDGPQDRLDWEEMSPAILIESPLPFDDASSPLRITGSANTFEATFQINVTDGDGLIVYDEFATATSGTGTRGTFDETVEFEVPRAGMGSVILFEYSAQDGRQINIVEVPVRIS